MSPTDEQKQSQLAQFLADPHRALWRLSLPILGGMTIHTLYSVIDMVFVGWVGPQAVAALAYNMPLVFFGIGITIIEHDLVATTPVQRFQRRQPIITADGRRLVVVAARAACMIS